MFARQSLRAFRAAPSARTFSTTPRSQLAKIQLIGHLAGAPEVSATSTGHEIVKYSLATSSGPRDNRQTSWWRVTAFLEPGPRRDFLTDLQKGTLIYVEGEAKMDSYETEGGKRSSLSIVHRMLSVCCCGAECEE
jgi:single-stranded DNA-binding protein